MTNRDKKTGKYQSRKFRGMRMGVILGGILAVGGVGYAQQQGHIDISSILSNTQEYTQEVITETVTVEVPVSEVDKRIAEAKEAAREQIESEKQAYIDEGIARIKAEADEAEEQKYLEIEIETRDEYIAEQEAINLEKKEQTKAH